MRKAAFIFKLVLVLAIPVTGQNEAKIQVEVSSDSVYMGHYFELKYTLENVQDISFDPPAIQGFDLISGPNTSSVMSMANGVMSQRISYGYVLRPRGEGDYIIPAVEIEVEGAVLQTEELRIVVLPNVEGIPQEQPQNELWNNQGLDLFQGFSMPDMNNFFFRAMPDSLNGFPDMEEFFKQMPGMEFPGFQFPPRDSMPTKKKRKTFKI